MGFFKAYDMRGTFGVDFDLDTVYRVGKALPQDGEERVEREFFPAQGVVGQFGDDVLHEPRQTFGIKREARPDMPPMLQQELTQGTEPFGQRFQRVHLAPVCHEYAEDVFEQGSVLFCQSFHLRAAVEVAQLVVEQVGGAFQRVDHACAFAQGALHEREEGPERGRGVLAV